MKEIIEIQATGSFFEVDSEGYLINPASEDKLQEKWKPAIEDIIDAYKENYGENLQSVYIRGSVAKGRAIEHISDIDTFAYVNLPQDEISNEWKKGFRKEMKEKYPFIEGIELMVIPKEGRDMNLILNQSLLVYGEPQPVTKLGLEKT